MTEQNDSQIRVEEFAEIQLRKLLCRKTAKT